MWLSRLWDSRSIGASASILWSLLLRLSRGPKTQIETKEESHDMVKHEEGVRKDWILTSPEKRKAERGLG